MVRYSSDAPIVPEHIIPEAATGFPLPLKNTTRKPQSQQQSSKTALQALSERKKEKKTNNLNTKPKGNS
jgi:hypothetical protein